MAKTKICPYCRSEIDKKAKICPRCQKKQGSGCGCATFAVIAAIALSIMVVKYVEPDTNPSSNETVQSEAVQMSEADFKAACKALKYEEIARPKDCLKGEKVTFTGEIIQATSGTYRMNVTKGEYGLYDDTVLFTIDESTLSENILEDDIVTIWGESEGPYTYKAVLGNEITVPKIKVAYIENHGKEN